MSIVCANNWVTKICEACGIDPGLVEKVRIEASPLDAIRVSVTIVANQEIEKALNELTDKQFVAVSDK